MRYRVDFLNDTPSLYINADTFYNQGDMVIFSINPTTMHLSATTGMTTPWQNPSRQVAAFRNWQTVVEDNSYAPAQSGDTEEDI